MPHLPTADIACPYCGAVNDIAESEDKVEELSLEEWLSQLESAEETHQQEQVKCTNCGGEQTLREYPAQSGRRKKTFRRDACT